MEWLLTNSRRYVTTARGWAYEDSRRRSSNGVCRSLNPPDPLPLGMRLRRHTAHRFRMLGDRDRSSAAWTFLAVPGAYHQRPKRVAPRRAVPIHAGLDNLHRSFVTACHTGRPQWRW